MELISSLFDMDLAKLVPDLPVFLGFVRTLLALAVLAGPALMMVLGALYLFKPAPEANYKYGFRTYFGMGSVAAWQFSQKVAGLIFGSLGVLLLIAMLVVVLIFLKKDLTQIAMASVVCLLIQALLALAARLAVGLLTFRFFDKDGNRKK